MIDLHPWILLEALRMPALTRWFVKTSFLCLALALIAGVLMGFQAVLGLTSLGGMFPVYIHLLVLGWLTQLVFGIAFWMFPKYSNEKPRGSEALGWWTYVLLNTGLLLRLIAEPVHAVHPVPLTGWILVLAAGVQLLAGVIFVLNTWPRVKAH